MRAWRDPEVLILTRDAAALYQLVGFVNTGRGPLPLVVDADAAINSADTAIKPIVIEPLAVAAGDEGVRP